MPGVECWLVGLEWGPTGVFGRAVIGVALDSDQSTAGIRRRKNGAHR
jgi:hypothetical protein